MQYQLGQELQESDWLTLLLSREPSHVKHSFEDESPGMAWARAKFQVGGEGREQKGCGWEGEGVG